MLVAALEEPDGFLRYKVVAALGAPAPRAAGTDRSRASRSKRCALKEARRYFNYLSLHYNLFGKEAARRRTPCSRARSTQKMAADR